uniref:magnesium-dependent phosphatase 1-like n=1 Tax=Styela clava TaxID=7725 RepID=UPI001939EA23|nr:magnesium-dependent phosphatase 1-like [Styela clava]
MENFNKNYHKFEHQMPKVIVFDLDYTLWPLWVDTHVDLPFKKLKNGDIVDKYETVVNLYEDVPQILETLQQKGITMAAASRTPAIDVAESLLDIMDLNKYFSAKEIYPGSKVAHFLEFKESLDIDYNHMLFFDDEERNIEDLLKLGVTAVHVPDGMSWEILNIGMEMFSQNS